MGTCLVFLTPPFQVLDEFFHFYRAYHVSEGKWFAQKLEHRVGDFLPASIHRSAQDLFADMPFHPEKKMSLSRLHAALAIPLAPDDRTFVDFNTTALIPPLAYVPQAAGIVVGRIFGFPPILMMYLGRLTNFLTWLILVFFSVRLTPVGKWVFVFLALAPMCIFQVASLSYDALAIGLAFMVTALALRMAFNPHEVVSWKELIGFCVSLAALGFVKFIYATLGAMFLIIPLRRFTSRKQYAVTLAVLFGLLLVAGVAWVTLARRLFITYAEYDERVRNLAALIPGVNPSEQLRFMVAHPRHFLGRLWDSLKYFEVMRSFVAWPGWTKEGFPWWFIRSYLAALTAVALLNGDKIATLSWKQRAVMFFAGMATVVFIGAFLFMQWSPVRCIFVLGLHGRYFIPIGPCVVLALFHNRFLTVRDRVLGVFVLVLLVPSEAFLVARLIRLFY